MLHMRPPVSGCSSTQTRSSAPSTASRTRSSRRNERLDEIALIGIHTRGVIVAQRLRRLIEEFAGNEVALGTVDITFYRDDVQVRGREAPLHPQPLVRVDEDRLPARGQDVHPRRRRPLHRPNDPRRDRRAVRLRPPRARPARRHLRPRPPRASDPSRLRRQEPPDRPQRAHPGAARRGGRGRPGPADPVSRGGVLAMPDITVMREELPPAARADGGTCSRSRTSRATTSSGCSRRRTASRTRSNAR